MGPMAFLGNILGGSLIKDVGDAIHQNVTSDKERMALQNEEKKAEYEFTVKLAQMDTDLAKGQMEVNAKEAENPHLFVAGWRPFIGWICGIVLALVFIPKALVLTGFWCYSSYLHLTDAGAALPALPPFPDLGTTDVLGLLGAMLGLGGMRTWEKVKGVETTGVQGISKPK